MAINGIGRPSSYTWEVAVTICGRLANGEALTTICQSNDMPSRRTVLKWLFDERNTDFVPMYTRAREAQAEIMAEEIISIADDSAGDITIDKDGREIVNHEAIQRSRLRVDTRKWVAAKLLPRKYGDHEHKTVHLDLGDQLANMLEKMQESAPNVTPAVTHDDVIDGEAKVINGFDDEST